MCMCVYYDLGTPLAARRTEASSKLTYALWHSAASIRKQFIIHRPVAKTRSQTQGRRVKTLADSASPAAPNGLTDATHTSSYNNNRNARWNLTGCRSGHHYKRLSPLWCPAASTGARLVQQLVPVTTRTSLGCGRSTACHSRSSSQTGRGPPDLNITPRYWVWPAAPIVTPFCCRCYHSRLTLPLPLTLSLQLPRQLTSRRV